MQLRKLSLILTLMVPLLAPSASGTHDPNDFFVLEASFPGVDFDDIHGSGSGDVWAVGKDSVGASRTYHRTGGSWALVASPNIGNLATVYAQSPTLAYAGRANAEPSLFPLGSNDYMVWDGATWTAANIPNLICPVSGINCNSETVSHVFVVSSTDVWALVTGGSVASRAPDRAVHWDGAAWTLCATCAFQEVQVSGLFETEGGLHGVSSTDIWANAPVSATSDFQGFYHWDGSVWTLTPGRFHAASIWAFDASNAFAVLGQVDAGVARWNGTLWAREASPMLPNAQGKGIWGTSPTDVWANDFTNIIHRDGGGWTTEPATPSGQKTSIYFSDASNGWFVTDTGQIFKLDVNPFVALPSLAGFMYDPDNALITASQAQCLGDEVSLSINAEPPIVGGATIGAYVINSDTNVVVEAFNPSTAWFNLNDRFFHTSRPYPAGAYQLLVTLDYVVAPSDTFEGVSFNVPVGTCLDADQDGSLDELTDQHFDQDLFHVGGGGGNATLLGQFPGMDPLDSSAILLFLIIMAFALWNGLFFLAGSALLGLLASWLPSLQSGGDWDGGVGFFLGLGLCVLGFWLEAAINGWKLKKANLSLQRDA